MSKIELVHTACFVAVLATMGLQAVCQTQPVAKQPLNGSLVKNAHAKASTTLPRAKTTATAATPAKTPHYHINFTPASSSTKRFDNFQSSIPDKATKTYLHKIKAEPNSLAGIMPTPEGQAASANQAPSTMGTNGTTVDTGSAPRLLSPSGVAIPQSTGSGSTFFK